MVFLCPPICVYQTTPPKKPLKGKDGIGIHPTVFCSPKGRKFLQSFAPRCHPKVLHNCNLQPVGVFFCAFSHKKNKFWKKHMLRSWPNWRKHISPKKKSGWKIPKNAWNHHNCNFQSIFLDLDVHHWWEVEKSGDFVLKVDVFLCSASGVCVFVACFCWV